MRLDLAYDARIAAWTFDNRRLALETTRDLEDLQRDLPTVMERIGHAKSDFLVALDGMRISPNLTAAYGAISKSFLADRCRHVVRYGTDLQAIVAMRSAALKAGFASAISPTREEAVRRLRALRVADQQGAHVFRCAPTQTPDVPDFHKA